MSVCGQIMAIERQVKGKARLVAVSKLQPDEKILEAYNCGFSCFGENYVQELAGKYERLPKDIAWHMIGHLQTNKVKIIAPFVSMIHSVDSERLLKEINKQAERNGRVIPVLLQVHIAREETKTGLSEGELFDILDLCISQPLGGVSVRGLMGMSTFTEDEKQVKAEFAYLKGLFDLAKAKYPQLPVCELSMGMSGDWLLAVETGSTLIRVGSAIFGERL